MFIINLCTALKDAGVIYAIVGGYAVALHGAVRGTLDIDIVIKWTLANLQNAENVMHLLGMVSRLPITANDVYNFRAEYIEKRNLIAWNFYHRERPSEQVDIIITYDLDEDLFELLSTSLGPLAVLKREPLIAMKRLSGRPQDLEDIKALEQL